MSSNVQACVYCAKDCRSSDSKPFPNSKSKDRIHNRCYIKKSLADKQVKSSGSKEITIKPLSTELKSFSSDLTASALDLIDRWNEDNEKLRADAQARKLSHVIDSHEQKVEKDREKSSFFFDMKAGIAKPHEKRRFLNHRKICEMAPRYDDHGFKEDAVGRSYDHTGKDLTALSDGSDDEEACQQTRGDCKSVKRKLDSNHDELNSTKRSNNRIDLSKTPCWFCLSSPTVEKHLIVAIGTHCYLTLAKGGLVEEHFLLIPIEHIGSITSRENSEELLAEKEQFINHIVKYFEEKSMSVAFFERNFRSVHWQIQAVPISKEIMRDMKKKIHSLSKKHYSKCTYIDFSPSLKISDIIPPGAPYLHWRLEPESQSFACKIDVKDSIFPVQLPRMVLAQIMDCPDRIDWKKCCKTREEYASLVGQIKDKWAKFDTS